MCIYLFVTIVQNKKIILIVIIKIIYFIKFYEKYVYKNNYK